MKKIFIILISIIVFSSCEDRFVDLEPLDNITEAAYFKTPEHFKAAANYFYPKLLGWRGSYIGTNTEYLDWGTDLTAYVQDYGRGVKVPPSTDNYWSKTYRYIREVNILLEKAEAYEGDKEEILEYVAVAKFFRAWHHFFLLQRYGGVPVVTSVLDLDSPELLGKRNSRYEVFAQVLTDLNEAIPDLPREQDIPDSDKGKISVWAAEALKAKALLYEATWENNVGTTTDGDGVSEGAGSVKPEGYPSTDEMISEAVLMAKDVMDRGGYELWNYNEDLENLSNLYLFNLENSNSNPAGLTKASNKESILYTMYDQELFPMKTNVGHGTKARLAASRKFMDMFLCSDGLPVDKSLVFLGYSNVSDEYQNRDYRLTSYFADVDTWDTPVDGSVTLMGPGGESGASYQCRKFRTILTEEVSIDYPHIRLAEVYLIYAEALYLKNGALTDEEMDESINLVKERAGLPPLTNAFAQANGLNVYEEILRERAVELYGENNRFHDLKRWGIAEEALNADVCGDVIEGTAFENNPDLYDPGAYPYGEITKPTGMGNRKVLLIDPASNRNFQRMHYLFPIPTEEINLNTNLVQNPGY